VANFSDPNPEYWQDYSNLQRVKHALIRCYLGGWFPKLGNWAGRVIYVDTHAGRGRHLTGELGSPLVALTTLLEHTDRERLLEKSEFRFLFIERDADNLAALQAELKQYEPLPSRVVVKTTAGDAFDVLSSLVEHLTKHGKKVAPAFVFVDPYGFKIPGELLAALMAASRVELFVNVIWRELDMAIAQGPAPGTAQANTLNAIFIGDEWRTEVSSSNVDERLDQAVRLFARKNGAKWWTYIRMISGGQATRYLLLHLTNHDEGRKLIKDCIWSVAPDGGYYVRKSDDPNQLLLIEPTPDLAPLRTWVLERLREHPQRWAELLASLQVELWREAHLNQVIRELRREALIVDEEYSGRFSAKANPLLRLPT
jgi:three-Cys-motif partner protein